MAGNSQRRGAIRKDRRGAAVGSGGRGRKALEGRAPTPKAEDRVGHPAHERKMRVAAKRARSRSPRERDGAEVVAGRNPVVEALRAGVRAETLHVLARVDADERVREALDLAVRARIDVRECSRADLDRITGGAVHQGLALAVAPFAYADFGDLARTPAPGTRPLVVALDGIQDPRNLGAILRSAAAFGVAGAVIPERRAASVTVAAWKSSAGAAARMPVCRVGNLPRSLEEMQRAGYFVVGLDARGDVTLESCPLLDEPVVIVVGSEGKGMSRLVRERCDQVAAIPMAVETESLNASVAASLALYEVARRRGETPLNPSEVDAPGRDDASSS
jgi:23S rRNA (guanosine2251-2'-O)-methyltransferase